MLTLRPDIYAAAILSDLVLLDVAEDTYQVVQGAVEPNSLGVAVSGICRTLHPEAAHALRDAGIVDERPASSRRHSSLTKPVASATNLGRTHLSLTDVLFFGAAMVVASWRARRCRTCRSFHGERAIPSTGVRDDVVNHALAELRTLRLVIPSPRRCLPSSLLAAAYLNLKGIDCEIVFGVRGSPFGAHCWVERGGVVIDDDHDRVCAFEPIAVGRP